MTLLCSAFLAWWLIVVGVALSKNVSAWRRRRVDASTQAAGSAAMPSGSTVLWNTRKRSALDVPVSSESVVLDRGSVSDGTVGRGFEVRNPLVTAERQGLG